MPTTLTVQDAEQQLAAATATVDQLKAKILDHGPGSVTAEELGTAALAVEHANLAVQHAIKTAETTAAAERTARLQEKKARYLAEAGDPDTIRDAMDMIAEGTSVIMRFCTGRQKLIAQGIREMSQDGVPQGNPNDEQHAGLSWSQAGLGIGDRLYIDGREISTVSAGVIIASAVARGARAAGKKEPGHLAPLDVNGAADPAAVNDPDAWLARKF